MSSELVIVLGTRPEIIKCSPVIRACEEAGVSYTLIHTGQHYSDDLDSVFFKQLELPTPDYNLEVGSQPHGQQTGEMIAGIEEILLAEDPEVALVQGDTNSVLAAAIAVDKLDIELGHIEAGLRSFDRDMPEESNRVMTDHVADYLFAPTEETAQHLQNEGIEADRIHVTGNTVVGAVQQNKGFARQKSTILADLGLAPDEFVLMTAHRAENVDTRDRFAQLLRGAGRVGERLNREVIYPIHPRAEQKLEAFDLEVPVPVRCIDPLDYLDFLRLEMAASLILTDSGGVQEEACILQVPCVTMRDNTERPETVAVGANVIAGTEPDAILGNAIEMFSTTPDWENPFGDGTAADEIIDVCSTPAPTIEAPNR